ncbi:MAG TPA: hypothetical protein VL970_12815 [Candidatus Acidoferrales bacterium]|nr:hypothetical protein [Candidatus Acidoferrales bacterium]
MPAVTGDESDDELREMVVEFASEYFGCQNDIDCPFRRLNGLTFNSLRHLLEGMDRPSILGLFDLECESRNREASQCPLIQIRRQLDANPAALNN